MAHRSIRTNQFHYFDTQFGGIDWTQKKILDFGGNIGGFLVEAPPAVSPENYTCLEVDKEATEIGKKQHPGAHFHWFDRYSCYDNVKGKVGLPVPFAPESFDVIISFSVFTHVSKPDMVDLITQLMTCLKPGGYLGFTFFDTFYNPVEDPNWNIENARPDLFRGTNLAHRLSQFTNHDVAELSEAAKGSRWITLINDDFRIEPPDDASPYEPEGSMFLQFYDLAYIQSLFPDGQILAPVAPERQHCMVLRKEA